MMTGARRPLAPDHQAVEPLAVDLGGRVIRHLRPSVITTARSQIERISSSRWETKTMAALSRRRSIW